MARLTTSSREEMEKRRSGNDVDFKRKHRELSHFLGIGTGIVLWLEEMNRKAK